MKKILLIDDEASIATMYQRKFETEGFTIEHADNGEEGLFLALQNHPDVILLDITLPKVDGITVLKKLREDAWGSTVAIILLTNMDPSDEILQAVTDYKPAYYLMKSNITPSDLVEKVKQL